MTMKKIARMLLVVLGIILVLLGGLWFVQGTGLVTIEPIWCVAECETVIGPNLSWVVMGIIAVAGGLFLIKRKPFERLIV